MNQMNDIRPGFAHGAPEPETRGRMFPVHRLGVKNMKHGWSCPREGGDPGGL